MITVPEATRVIIKRSRYLSEAISKDLINYSSLARYIKPEIEQMLLKDVSTSAVIMALKRLEKEFQPHYKNVNIFKSAPSLIIHSSLSLLTVKNSNTLNAKLNTIDQLKHTHNFFLLKIQGLSETCLLYDNVGKTKLEHILEGETIVGFFSRLSSLSIKLPQESQTSPGIFYFFLKSLAWEGINILEIFSTSEELTLVFSDEEIQKAFAIIKSLFNQ